LGVALPDRLALRLDRVLRLELGHEERRQDVRRKKARADVDPGVLVYLTAEEARAVGPLVSDDLSPLDEPGIVDHERAPFAAGEVLRLVEAQGGQLAERSQRLPPEPSVEPMRIVLDEEEATLLGNRGECLHLAADAGVVDRDDGLGPARDGPRDLLLIDIQGVTPYVDEHRAGPSQGERVRCRDEREGRHDDLVSGAEIEENRRHLERVGARGRQDHLRAVKGARQLCLAALREPTVSGYLAAADCLSDVDELLSLKTGAVE